MNKKDRIAISITIIWLFVFLVISSGEILTIIDERTLVVFGPIIVYWIFRFVKNDISFLSNKGDN